MIDKINDNISYGYQNSGGRNKNPAVRAYENTPGAELSKKKKTDKKNSAANGHVAPKHAPAAQGVLLDLSVRGVEQSHEEKKQSLSARLRRLFAPVLAAIKNFWAQPQTVSKENAAVQPEAVSEENAAVQPEAVSKENAAVQPEAVSKENAAVQPEAVPEESAPDESLILPEELPPLDTPDEPVDYEPLLAQAVRAKDIGQLTQALTQNGARQPAHNSDLLTYYDRHGRLVELDDTEKHRVLHGDKSILKL